MPKYLTLKLILNVLSQDREFRVAQSVKFNKM